MAKAGIVSLVAFYVTLAILAAVGTWLAIKDVAGKGHPSHAQGRS